MDAERMDALLMDHALGETTPDVAALVEAYVEKDAAARATLEEWRATAGLATRALQGKPVVLPAFPRAALVRSQTLRQWRSRILWGTGMAACLALGVAVGIRWNSQEQPPVVPLAQAPVVPLPPPPMRIAAVRDFWSISRLRAIAENTPKPVKATPWANPFRRPTL
jgi:anti-sigma factor RsiW